MELLVMYTSFTICIWVKQDTVKAGADPGF